MSELEKYVADTLAPLVPDYERLDVRANIGDNSYSVEFFVTIDGKKMQCYDMADNGMIKEKILMLPSAQSQNIFARQRTIFPEQ